MRSPRLAVPLAFAVACASAGAISTGCGGGGSLGPPPVVRQSLDDAQLLTGVKSALLNDPQLGGQAIDITVSQGIVSLSGTVRSADDATRAQQLARQVSGVKDVRSKLRIQQ